MNTGILHYSVPPVIGGVESVIQAHARQFAAHGLPLKVLAGRGDPSALAEGVQGVLIPELDTLHPEICAVSAVLDTGIIPEQFDGLVERIAAALRPHVADLDVLIVHNVLTKHFNLPLTAALFRLMDSGELKHVVAWCHDLTWTSVSSRHKVYERYPWNLLKTPSERVRYVAISLLRQKEVCDSFGLPAEAVEIIYNGVDPSGLLGLSPEGAQLAERLDLWNADLAFLMPVRVTRAKNVEFALEFTAELKKLDLDPRVILTGPPDPHSEDSLAYYRGLLQQRRELGVEKEFRFVYESGPDAAQPYTINEKIVSELFRVCDVMFMPSLREGFGMPVLEAGLSGMPVLCSNVPAAMEIALEDVFVFSLHSTDAARLALDVLNWAEEIPSLRLRSRIRQEYTWRALFEQNIEPLLRQLA